MSERPKKGPTGFSSGSDAASARAEAERAADLRFGVIYPHTGYQLRQRHRIYSAGHRDGSRWQAEEDHVNEPDELKVAGQRIAELEAERVAIWDQAYQCGVSDERTSEANIGIAGGDWKVPPARENPYRKEI